MYLSSALPAVDPDLEWYLVVSPSLMGAPRHPQRDRPVSRGVAVKARTTRASLKCSLNVLALTLPLRAVWAPLDAGGDDALRDPLLRGRAPALRRCSRA